MSDIAIYQQLTIPHLVSELPTMQELTHTSRGYACCYG
jgi:hypothetical protein